MRTLQIALAMTLFAGPVFAKGKSPHHCMKDGAETASKSKKECKKEGGTWEKMTEAPK